MLGLEWDRVDLQNSRIRLEAKHTKSKKARTVPLNRNAHEVLLKRKQEQAKQSMDTVRRQNLVDLKLPELRETLAHQVVLMLITVMHLLAERQGL